VTRRRSADDKRRHIGRRHPVYPHRPACAYPARTVPRNARRPDGGDTMTAATDISPSQNYVDVVFAPDAKALVTISSSSMHTLSPDGAVCGPLALEVTP